MIPLGKNSFKGSEVAKYELLRHQTVHVFDGVLGDWEIGGRREAESIISLSDHCVSAGTKGYFVSDSV